MPTLADVFAPGGGQTPSSEQIFTVTELTRNSDGRFEAGAAPVRFEWDNKTQSAPRPSWAFGLKQRTRRRDYSGADDPSEQVLGPNFKPFTIAGEWNDRYAGAGFAIETFRAFEALVARGNPVEIQFETIRVTGLITDFDVTYRRSWQIGYSFTVSPHFRTPGGLARTDRPQVPRALAQPENLIDPLKASTDDLIAVQTDLSEESELAIATAASSQGIIASTLNRITQLVGFVNELGLVIEQQLFGPIEQVTAATSRLAQTMRDTRSTSVRLLEDVANIHAETELAYQTALNTLDFTVWRTGLAASARRALLDADRAEKVLRERVDPGLLAVHRTQPGETLYSISTRYYGTPHQWRLIADTNHIDYTTFEGGEILIIPAQK